MVDAISIRTQALAQRALGRIDEAVITRDNIRAHLGATQNRLENTISSLQIQAENPQAAESRISDVDVALEMTEFVRRAGGAGEDNVTVTLQDRCDDVDGIEI